MQTRWETRVEPGGLQGVQEAIAKVLAERTPAKVWPGELDRDGRALRWVEAGSGTGAPVVLIAGSGTSSLTWAPVLPALAEHGRVVAYDRAGLGASEPDRTLGLTLEAQIGDLAALLRHLDAGPAILVGHSWGGQLAQLLAWQRPELVAGLVLVDPAHEEFRPPAIGAAEAVLIRLWLLRTVLAPPVGPGADDALARAEAAVVAHPHQRRTVLSENRMTGLAVPELRRRRTAGRLPEVPVAVLSATEGLPRAMRARWTALQSRIAANAARGGHIVVSGAGHAVHADKPRAVIAAVLEVSEHARNIRDA